MENADAKKKCVYMTALSNEKYIPGVKGLKNALCNLKSCYDLVVLIPEEREKELTDLLIKNGVIGGGSSCSICVKPQINIEINQSFSEENNYWSNTFFKLQAAGCTEFAKIVLLDSDMMIMRNIDLLFDCPNYSAVAAGKLVHPEYTKLNSGLMVLEPSEELYSRLISNIEPTIKRCHESGRNAGDQDVFQDAFPEWENHKELSIPEIYNVFYNDIDQIVQQHIISQNEIAIVHFIGKKKPWSNKIFSLDNLKVMVSLLLNRKIWKLKMYFRYLWYCK